MSNKRRSAAQKQRAKARQQANRERAAATAEETADATSTTTTSTTSRPRPKPQQAGGHPKQRTGAKRRRSSRMGTYAIVAVLGVVGLMVVLFLSRSNSQKQANASQKAIDTITSVPASAFTQAGVPNDLSPPVKLPAGTPPVEQNGKPATLYVGAEYCPYCAAERWPFVVALSRFGTFSGLSATTSSANDVYPNTPTLTFHGSDYTSDYVTLSAVETQTNTGQPLDTPTDFQQQLFSTYNTKDITGSNGGIPFIMIGNKFAWAGSTYHPDVLKGKSFDQIAKDVADPSSAIGKQVLGSANLITAQICELTNNQPTDVCTAPEVQQAQQKLSTL